MSKVLRKFQRSKRIKDLTSEGNYLRVSEIAEYVADSTKDIALKDYADFVKGLDSDPEMAKVFQNFQALGNVKGLTDRGEYEDLSRLAYMHGNTSASNELRSYAEFLRKLSKKKVA